MAATHVTFARKAIPADPPASVTLPRDRQIAEAACSRSAVGRASRPDGGSLPVSPRREAAKQLPKEIQLLH
jgi:hypothetical protein